MLTNRALCRTPLITNIAILLIYSILLFWMEDLTQILRSVVALSSHDTSLSILLLKPLVSRLLLLLRIDVCTARPWNVALAISIHGRCITITLVRPHLSNVILVFIHRDVVLSITIAIVVVTSHLVILRIILASSLAIILVVT